MENKIVIYTTEDSEITFNIDEKLQTVWATQPQIASLFGIDRTTALRHINNILKDEEVDKESNVQKIHIPNSNKPVMYYSLDIILSVGYRTNSSKAIAFRKWANSVLKEYILKGYALNQKRLDELHTVIKIISHSNIPEISEVANVLDYFAKGLTLLDDYDHQVLKSPSDKKSENLWKLTYEEGRKIIDSMKFAETSDLFGNEKDNSFKSTLGAIYQTFGGKDVYPTVQEKAANLLYMLVKNHSFNDGNKRIAAALFVYFLDKNKILYTKDKIFVIDNNTLAAMTLMIALSRPEEKETMCLLVLNMLHSEE